MPPTRDHDRSAAPGGPGFSLVELMVAMSIAMVVIAAVLSSYTYLGRNLVRDANQQLLEIQTRRTLQLLVQDVHAADRVAYAYDTTQDITQDSSWQTLPTSNQIAFRVSTPDGSGGTYTYAVTYVYSTSAGTLTRTVSSGVGSGTAPANFNGTSAVVLTGLPKTGDPIPLWAGFQYLDSHGGIVNGANYPVRIKQIVMQGFTVTNGSASAGSQSRLDGASAQLVLRNKSVAY